MSWPSSGDERPGLRDVVQATSTSSPRLVEPRRGTWSPSVDAFTGRRDVAECRDLVTGPTTVAVTESDTRVDTCEDIHTDKSVNNDLEGIFIQELSPKTFLAIGRKDSKYHTI